jgi:hypothetical protein
MPSRTHTRNPDPRCQLSHRPPVSTPCILVSDRCTRRTGLVLLPFRGRHLGLVLGGIGLIRDEVINFLMTI